MGVDSLGDKSLRKTSLQTVSLLSVFSDLWEADRCQDALLTDSTLCLEKQVWSDASLQIWYDFDMAFKADKRRLYSINWCFIPEARTLISKHLFPDGYSMGFSPSAVRVWPTNAMLQPDFARGMSVEEACNQNGRERITKIARYENTQIGPPQRPARRWKNIWTSISQEEVSFQSVENIGPVLNWTRFLHEIHIWQQFVAVNLLTTNSSILL